jgi:hypothetical protein
MIVHIDWDRGHGPASGPFSAGITALSVSWLGHVAHLPPGWAVAAAGAGLLGTAVAGVRKGWPGLTLALHAATWLAAGAWGAWAIGSGPWHPPVLAVLAAGAVGLGISLVGAHKAEKLQAVQQAAVEAAVERASMDWQRQKLADEWDARLALVCSGATVKIVGVEHWESGGGYTLDGECLGGTKWRDLTNYGDALAAEAKLPEGCGVEVRAGAHRGAVLFDVTTVNAFVNDCPYPADYSPFSINDPAPFGIYRDGSQTTVVLRQLTGLIAARKGAGKTNLLNVAILNDCRMVDNLTWVIDLNGGGLALAWLHAWEAAGRPGKPPVDWVADTPAKALAMSRAGLAIALARKPGYKKREIEANDDKLPVGPDVPAISIKGDEAAELFSPRARKDEVLREVGDNLVRITELARAAAVNEILAALRVTQDVISEPQVLRQAGLRIGMQSDEAELNYLLGWRAKVTPEDIPYPGCGVIKVGEEQERAFKAYRVTPKEIAEVVVETAGWRPELDELSRRAAGPAYESRWDGTDHLFGIGPAPEPPVEQVAPERPRSTGVTADWGTAAATGSTGTQAALDDADAARRRLQEAVAAAGDHDPDTEEQFRAILAGGGIDWAKPAQTAEVEQPVRSGSDPRIGLVLDIVRKAGAKGISPSAAVTVFANTYPGQTAPSRSAVTGWLAADPRIHQPGRGLYAFRTVEEN